MTVFIGVGLVAREIDRRSIFSLLAKPLPRWEFIVGKYVGLVLTIVVNVAAMTAALYLMLAWMDWTSPADVRLVLGSAGDRSASADRGRADHRGAGAAHRVALFFSTFSSSALLSVVFTVGLFVAGLASADLRDFGDIVDAPRDRRDRVGDRLDRPGVFRLRRQERGRARPSGAGRARRLRRSLYAAVYSAALVGGRGRRLLPAGVQMSARPDRADDRRRVVAGLGARGRPCCTRASAVSAAAQSTERLLYLQVRQGRRPRCFSSFDALAADVYWIRTIQHYGRDRKSRRTTGRFELLQPLLDLTTTLDPHFNIAYRFGAIFLAMRATRTGRAGPTRRSRCSRRDSTPNPTAGSTRTTSASFTTGTRATTRRRRDWFERAAAMPRAPAWIRPLAATTRRRAGIAQGARQMLTELLRARPRSTSGRRGRARSAASSTRSTRSTSCNAIDRAIPRRARHAIRPTGTI